MSTIIQQAVILSSQNQLRNADRLAREWAIAHAGSYKSQATNQLGGSLPFREWKNDNLTIRMAKLATGTFKQVQLASVNYEPAGDTEPFTGYIMTYAYSETDKAGGYCITVASLPDDLDNAEFPWDEKAGPVGLERTMATIKADRSRSSARSGDDQEIAAVDDLFGLHDTAIVLTEDGQKIAEFQELVGGHGDWAALVDINASEQLTISRELPDDQLPAWVRANVSLFSRYADSDGKRLRMAETDCAEAAVFLDEERDRVTKGITGSNTIAALQVLESVSVMLSISMLTDAKEMAEALVEVAAQQQPEIEESDTVDSVATQQRVFVLEDKLSEAENTITELRERLAQYETFDAEAPVAEDPDDEPHPENPLDINRHVAVLDAITNPERFPRLRFLTNCEKDLAGYGKPRPNGVDIVAALDSINTLAQAWYNTPNGAIGSWSNYFINLPGWKYADDESDTTMARFGEKRSFSDQEKGRLVEITRHLTYQGSSSGLQIYFDRDDVTDSFIIGYIGEHLPYATSRS